jgi:hypothetical protein
MPRANVSKWNINASRVPHFERFAVQRTPNNSGRPIGTGPPSFGAIPHSTVAYEESHQKTNTARRIALMPFAEPACRIRLPASISIDIHGANGKRLESARIDLFRRPNRALFTAPERSRETQGRAVRAFTRKRRGGITANMGTAVKRLLLP